jgi:spore germination cell wall hydrolase CwlJ-like protein
MKQVKEKKMLNFCLNLRYFIGAFLSLIVMTETYVEASVPFLSIAETYELAKTIMTPKADSVESMPVVEKPIILSEQEKDLITKTIWAEARGQTFDGQIAVAEVILKRLRNSEAGVSEIVKAPKQFSCWNKRDPNRKKMQKLNATNPGYQIARNALEIALKGEKCLTKGADHYHAKYVKPRWARGQKPVVTIGSHHFYSINA